VVGDAETMSNRYWDVWDKDRPEYYIKTYGEPNNPKKEHLRRMKMALELITGESVLDVGCGIGHMYHLLPKNIKYMGIDTSEPMLEFARKYADADFRYGDVFNLSAFDNYETVLSQSLLIHLPEVEKPIQQMWSKTSKELIFTIPISGRDQVNVWRRYKDKQVLSNTKTMDTVTRIIKHLPDYKSYKTIVEPSSKIGNTFFKVTKNE